MKKMTANDTEDPISPVYRITIINRSNNDKDVRTITADNPDDAIFRVMDMISGGLFEPDEFWDKYKILSVVEELK